MKKLLFVLLMALSSPSVAATIALQTGFDGGSTLAAGSVDADWQISIGGAPSTDSVVAYPAQIIAGMDTVTSDAAWITDPSVTSGSSATGWGSLQDVEISTTFDLSGLDASTATLDGIWRIADFTMGVFLNGILVPGTDIGLGDITWFGDRVLPTVSTGFLAGINTLTFVGQSGGSGYDALWFSGAVEADLAPIPLPAAFPLFAGGLGLLGLLGWRRKRLAAA